MDPSIRWRPQRHRVQCSLRMERRRQSPRPLADQSATVPAGVNPDTGHGPRRRQPRGRTCPRLPRSHRTGGFHGQPLYNNCPGDVTASSDLSHFVFATEWNVFAPGGQLSAPGSVYDNNTDNGTVAVASKTPAGDDIPSRAHRSRRRSAPDPRRLQRRIPHPDGRRRHRAMRIADCPYRPAAATFASRSLPDAAEPPLHAGRRRASPTTSPRDMTSTTWA